MAAEIDTETILKRLPPEDYLPIAKKAADRIPPIREDAVIYDMLFDKDELEWLQSQYKGRRT